MYLLVFVAIAIIGALIQITGSKQPRTLAHVTEIFLLWFIIIYGIAAVFAFISHVFYGPQTAKLIGWPPNNPFQFEVGIANLGVGILGLMCIWQRGNFWLATITMITVFGWGAAVGHIIQIVNFRNYASGNAGGPLYADILWPLVLIGLYIANRIAAKREPGEDRATLKAA